MNNYLIASIAVLVLAGCANNKSMYYWGEYENLIYQSYRTPGEATPDIQVIKLEEDIEKAKAKGKKIPPGIYSHLGMMYAATGNHSLALEALEMEKTLFPESSVLIDGMISRSLQSPKEAE